MRILLANLTRPRDANYFSALLAGAPASRKRHEAHNRMITVLLADVL
jgi:hypothetical protein